jgi:septal ring factor EnvC (AmiA/AmiB activator)
MAQKKLLEFLDQRLGLQIDFQDIDEEIRKQDEKIAQVRDSSPEINEYISKLESNLRLSEKENEKLVKQVEEFLRR